MHILVDIYITNVLDDGHVQMDQCPDKYDPDGRPQATGVSRDIGLRPNWGGEYVRLT